MARKMIDAPLRDGSAYRADRLDGERERLHRRLVWAIHRGDDKAIDWLEGRLLAIEEEIDADLSPGRAPGRHDWHRRR